jgi:phytanoyl-CoA hydroxylase
MRHQLTAEEITSYQTNGFVVIDDFLTEDELGQWRDAVDDAVAERGDNKLPGETGKGFTGSNNAVFKQRIQLWMDNEKVERLMLDARIGQMAAELEGVDGIRIWHDQTLIKMPWGNPTSWHQDNTKWSFTSNHSISIWIALDDATPHNGCLYFLPGSHRERYGDVATAKPMSEIFERNPRLQEVDPVAAPMKAGSCSFHNGLTVHGAGANMTRGLRRAMTCAFMPDGETYNGNKNVLPQSYVDTLAVGDVIDNDELVPLIYKRDAVRQAGGQEFAK